MNGFFRIISTLVITFSSTVAMGDVAVISNLDANVGDIDSFSVRDIFLGERTSFPNGVYANPINHKQGSQDRNIFFHNVLSMSEQAHDRHWSRKQKKRTMRTIAYRPEEAGSYTDVLKTVANTSGGIGYIDASMVNDSVIVLMTIKTSDDGLTGKIFASK